MPGLHPRILYVDDQDCFQMVKVMLDLEKPDYRIFGASSAENAVQLIDREVFDLYVMDYVLPEDSGLDLCRRIRENDSETPILFFTGMSRPNDRRSAMQAGATEYLVKPNDLDKLTETITRLLENETSSDGQNF